MMQQTLAKLEADQAVFQLLAELEPPLLQNQVPAAIENAPRKPQLRNHGERKNQALLPKNIVNKTRKQPRARAQAAENKPQIPEVAQLIRPMFTPNNAYLSVGDYLLFDCHFETHVVHILLSSNITPSIPQSSRITPSIHQSFSTCPCSQTLNATQQLQLKIGLYRRIILQSFVAYRQIESPIVQTQEVSQQSLSSTSSTLIRQILPQQNFACFLNACADAGVLFA